jgi:hypothetical protein
MPACDLSPQTFLGKISMTQKPLHAQPLKATRFLPTHVAIPMGASHHTIHQKRIEGANEHHHFIFHLISSFCSFEYQGETHIIVLSRKPQSFTNFRKRGSHYTLAHYICIDRGTTGKKTTTTHALNNL